MLIMKSTHIKQFFVTIILIFILQAVMLIYLFGSFYKKSAADEKSLGESNLAGQAAMIENYMNKGYDALWLAADSVEALMENGADREDILAYLTKESDQLKARYDANFTGLYGVVDGSYIDGSGWIPPEDYDPAERDWFKEAAKARGDMVLSSPYVDAQTGEIIVSFTKQLSDHKSVLALDIVLNKVQGIVEQMTMGEAGYSFIVDGKGLVLAHSDPEEIGKDYTKEDEKIKFISGLRIIKSGSFEMELEGKKCTVFTEKIEGDWNMAFVVNNASLFRRIRIQLIVGIVVSVLIYSLIVLFCIISVRRIESAEKSERASMEQLRRMNLNIIQSLASAIDAKDIYTSGHSQRVADYAVRIAKKLGKSEETQQILYYAGMLHDVGKIRVDGEVINKPGKLTDEEFDQIRIHPVSGYHILRDIHDDARIGYGAKYHHERFDGTGYPSGLKGTDIPEAARIIAVADAYDAMASDRSYRKMLSQKVVRDEIQKGMGSQFDPEIAKAMLEIIDEDTEYELRQSDDGVHNILVVDDDKEILQEMITILQDIENICLRFAGTKQETLEMLEDNEFALILLNPGIADTDGLALYADIRDRYDTPVILLTETKSMEIVKKVEELKIDDYLVKPLQPAIFKETIRALLQRSEAHLST